MLLGLSFFDDEVEAISIIDSLTSKKIKSIHRATIFPSTHYVASKERKDQIIEDIKIELKEKLNILKKKVSFLRLKELSNAQNMILR